MFHSSRFLHIISAILVIILFASACAPAQGTGTVQGVVYADTNGNGAIEASEGPLDGASVTIAGCGADQTKVTAADGVFQFTGLTPGSCNVSVSKTGWVFSGSYPSLGYPIPVASDPSLPTAFSIFMAPVVNALPTDTPTLVPTVPTETATPTLIPTASAPMVKAKNVDVNCRYGPGLDWEAVGALNVGQTVPVYGTNADHTSFQIDSNWNAGMKCWVAASATDLIGDIASLPVLPPPVALVTKVTVSTPAVIHGFCQGPNATSFSVSITTNGPANVTYHLEIYNGDGSLRNSTGDTILAFASASTQTFDPGGAYKTDCGDYYVKAIVTAPNNRSGQANWSVVSP
jgi:uncharacterized protein YraI